ncbi:hypothetical protein [Brevundimonas sp.]|uniref:hypothetical protein n=1 Tax=Brevundimonas sp. TaxID=1871086 RepID=UPI003F6FA9E2
MTRIAPWLIAATLSLTLVPQAQAVCSYHGELYSRTTLQQEFADAPLVVRARLILALNGGPMSEGDPWTVYQLETVSAFKGEPPRRVYVVTERNSGGFYMDRDDGEADVGQDYLLFLQPADAEGTWRVNYSCGQSRPWREVDAAAQETLQALSTVVE